jgi:hypothetical protein
MDPTGLTLSYRTGRSGRRLRVHRLRVSQAGRHAQAADEASTLSRQCLSQSHVNFLRGLFLHAGHHMAVRVQGNINGGVTEALADSFGSGHTSTADLLEVYVT